MYQFKLVERPWKNLQDLESPTIKNKPEIEIDYKMSNLETVTRYECLKCFLTFSSNAGCVNHLKIHKIVLPDGVYRDSLVQKVVSCSKCNKQIESCSHVCEFVCAACFNVFKTLRLYDEHVRKWHDEGLETLFFPNMAEFEKWKFQIGNQTGSRYFVADNYCGKWYYHCSMRSNGNPPNFLCPSTIIAQEFENGVQVYFYKAHFKHKYSDYLLYYEKYKKWHTTTVLPTHNNDMYVQFKGLLDNIIIESARLNGRALSILMGKALEMALILTNYEDDNDISINSDELNKIEKNKVPNNLDTNAEVGEDKLDSENEDRQNTEHKSRNTPEKYKSNTLKTYSRKRVACTIDPTKPLSNIVQSLETQPHDASDPYTLQKFNESDPLNTSNYSDMFLQNHFENTDSFNNSFSSFIINNYNVSSKKKRTINKKYDYLFTINSKNYSSSTLNQTNISKSHQNKNSENVKKYYFYIDENGTITTKPSSNIDKKDSNEINDGSNQIKLNDRLSIIIDENDDNKQLKDEPVSPRFVPDKNYANIEFSVNKDGNHIQTEINNSLEQYMKIHCKLDDVKRNDNNLPSSTQHNVNIVKSKQDVRACNLNKDDKITTVNDNISAHTTRELGRHDTLKIVDKDHEIKNEIPDSTKRKSTTCESPFIKSNPKISVCKFALEKPKVDLEYEVKEQESDCNILVLKI